MTQPAEEPTGGVVLPLREAKIEPDPHMVEMVEKFLERVKRGEVLAVAFAVHVRGDATGQGFSLGVGGDVAHLVCAIERVKLSLLLHEG